MSLKNVIVTVSAVLVVGVACADGTDDGNRWIDEYIRTTTTETINADNEGRVKDRTTVVDTQVEVRRKVTETTRVDTNGVETVVYRRTEGYNTVYRSAQPVSIVVEGCDADGHSMVVKSITTVTATANGSITTVESRDKSGALVVTRRTTYDRDATGLETSTIETLGANGELVVTQTTTCQRE